MTFAITAATDLMAVMQRPRLMSHAYDNPDLSAVQFLLAVMRDQSVSLHLRLRAAQAVAPFTEHGPRPIYQSSDDHLEVKRH